MVNLPMVRLYSSLDIKYNYVVAKQLAVIVCYFWLGVSVIRYPLRNGGYAKSV